MYHPSLEELEKLKTQGNLAPVYREIQADLETPVSAFLKIARGDYSFLLESVEGGERLARYSFIGTEPAKVIRTGTSNEGVDHPSPNLSLKGRGMAGEDPLKLVEEEFKDIRIVPAEGLPRFHGGMVGYLSYEVARYFEELPAPECDPLGLPEAVLMLSDTLLVFDHLTHKIKVVSHVSLEGDIEKNYRESGQRIDALVERLRGEVPNETRKGTDSSVGTLPQNDKIAGGEETGKGINANVTQAQYEEMVRRMKEHIYKGDIIQGVPSLRLGRRTNADPFAIYRALRSVNPSPYMYFLKLKDFHIVGTSPEQLVRVEDGTVSSHPIAGTRPRGKDNKEDKRLETELKKDEKERAEHVMLVDLARNDVGRISEPGTVEVSRFMEVEKYSHVMHLVSNVQGKLRKGLNQFDALRACFPAGTVSGAPKIRAMQIIAELEPDKRGPYAGAVGYFDYSGNMDTAITIRTIVVKNETAYVQAGAGIVQDSEPEKEYRECLNKAQALLTAIDVAEGA